MIRVSTFIFALLLVGAAVAGEREERDSIGSLSGSLFAARDFLALEELAGSYRESQDRTSAGMLKLRKFYGGIDEAAPSNDPDPPDWAYAMDTVEQWIGEYPNSPTPYVAKAHLLAHHGWAYRGTGWASTVEPEDRVRFKQLSKKAKELLVAHKSVASRDPEFYSLVASADLALGSAEAEFRSSLDEGMAAFPSYDELYFRGREYYSPRWYGSEHAMESFIVEALRRTSDKRGREMYARLYWAAGQRTTGGYYFVGPIADWGMMRDGIRDLIGRYPDPWNVNHLAFFACVKGDLQLAEELIQMIKGPIIVSAWSGRGNFDLCQHRIDQNKTVQE